MRWRCRSPLPVRARALAGGGRVLRRAADAARCRRARTRRRPRRARRGEPSPRADRKAARHLVDACGDRRRPPRAHPSLRKTACRQPAFRAATRHAGGGAGLSCASRPCVHGRRAMRPAAFAREHRARRRMAIDPRVADACGRRFGGAGGHRRRSADAPGPGGGPRAPAGGLVCGGCRVRHHCGQDDGSSAVSGLRARMPRCGSHPAAGTRGRRHGPQRRPAQGARARLALRPERAPSPLLHPPVRTAPRGSR